MTGPGEPIVVARNVRKEFRGSDGRTAITAVAGVHLEIARGETLGLVGESGSGKSTLGRLLLWLVEPDEGEIIFAGQQLGGLRTRQLRLLRPRMQIVFQDPYASLNPRMRVREATSFNLRPLGLGRGQVRKQVEEAIRLVGLPLDVLDRYPHQLSGGQAQRVGIARALVSRPEFVVADEVVSALDVSVQADILNLLLGLRDRLQLTTLFISHNLDVVRYVSDRIAVMYRGHVLEVAPSEMIYSTPLHPYTRLLISAIPSGERDSQSADELREREELRRLLAALDLGSPLREAASGHFVAEEAFRGGGRQADEDVL